MKTLPSLEILNECFALCNSSPSQLVWKVRPASHFKQEANQTTFNKRYAGKTAGGIFTGNSGKLYYTVCVQGTPYLVHRIVYAMSRNVVLATDIQIDHEDGNGLNNTPTNVRLATHAQNQHNESLRKNNTSGLKGVNWHKARGCWTARVRFQGKRYQCYAKTPEEVHERIQEIRQRLHAEFCNHGSGC